MKTKQTQKNILDGWKVEKLSIFFDITSSKRVFQDEWKKDGVPFYRARELVLLAKNNFVDNELFISEEMFIEYSKKYGSPLKDDLLITGVGTIGVTYLVKKGDKFYFKDGNVIWLKNKKLVSSKFVEYAFHTRNIRKQVIGGAAITTVATYTIDNAKNTKILLPPIPEQRRIVKILETLDGAIEKLVRKIEIKKDIKKGLMQRLLTGETRLSGFTSSWEKVSLGDVSKMSSGGTPKSTDEDFYGGEIPWVSITDMTSNGKYLYSTLRSLSKKGLENSTAKIYPKGTILYAMYASIGECSIAGKKMSSSQAILGMVPLEDKLDPMFLYYHLSSIKNEIKLKGQQGTQSNLNAGMVRKFVLKLPPVREQKEIVRIIELSDNEIEQFTKKLAFLKDQKKYLLNNLITGKIRTPESIK